jgi:serpin B
VHGSPLSRRKFLTLTGAGALAAGFGPLARACPPIEGAKDVLAAQKDAARAINGFGADLYPRLAGKEKGSLFLSPFSIETALAMTGAGARGKTLDEMEKVLHLPKDPHAGLGELAARLSGPVIREPRAYPLQGPLPKGVDPVPGKRPYELSVANAIWAQKGFPWEKAFLTLTRTHYGAGTVEVDFAESEAARERINAWVEKETREKIKELIGPGVITSLTRMVLANAIYFKSTWQHRFDKKHTKDAPFTRADGTTADVPLMALTGTLNSGKAHFGGRPVEVLELPYAGKELSMLVFLPEKGREFERLASVHDVTDLAPRLAPTEVNVFLPRFQAESTFDLNAPLADMGMKTAFGPDADFTGMSPEGKRLSISHVIHKAFVDVNEEGTEAAAATAVAIKERGAPPRKEFRADRPFVFAIRDNATGAALFLGRYAGPAK